MRVVADPDTIVSGLLWQGTPRRVLDAARAGAIDLFTSAVLLVELEDVLGRDKFAQRLSQANVTGHELILGYAALVTLVTPVTLAPVIIADPDDGAVLACAVAAHAEVIVSGDNHLLSLREYESIYIFSAADLLTRISQ